MAPAHDSSAFGKLLKRIGPGFVTGTSDEDPSAIGTYSQTGAQFGLTQLCSRSAAARDQQVYARRSITARANSVGTDEDTDWARDEEHMTTEQLAEWMLARLTDYYLDVKELMTDQ